MPRQTHPEQEMDCVVHWFDNWNPEEKHQFARELLILAVPDKVCLLLDQLNSSSFSLVDEPVCLFRCQIKLVRDWCTAWSNARRNQLMERLEKVDPAFVSNFQHMLADTSGMD